MPTNPTANKGPVTMKEAAERILRSNRGPLKVKTITDAALRQGRIATQGKTPAATMSAELAMDIKRHPRKSPFVRTAPGTYGLRGRDKRGQGEKVRANIAA